MLQTQSQHWTCQCGTKYAGIEGLKYNHKNGEARIVWKKVRLAGELKQVPIEGSFECGTCHRQVYV